MTKVNKHMLWASMALSAAVGCQRSDLAAEGSGLSAASTKVGRALAALTLQTHGFDSGPDGFIYKDDVFASSAPAAAAGQAAHGQLEVKLGLDYGSGANSGGWEKTFNAKGVAQISVDYEIAQASHFEPAECAEVRVAVDGTFYGSDDNPWVVRLCGVGPARERSRFQPPPWLRDRMR